VGQGREVEGLLAKIKMETGRVDLGVDQAKMGTGREGLSREDNQDREDLQNKMATGRVGREDHKDREGRQIKKETGLVGNLLRDSGSKAPGISRNQSRASRKKEDRGAEAVEAARTRGAEAPWTKRTARPRPLKIISEA
jgi:hypothetical protein